MELPFKVPADFTTLSDDALDALYSTAYASAAEVRLKAPHELTDDDMGLLEAVVKTCNKIDEEQERRVDRLAKANDLLSAFAAGDEDEDDGEDGGEDDGGGDSAPEPATPAPAAAPVTAAAGGATTRPRVATLAKTTPVIPNQTIDFSRAVLPAAGAEVHEFTSWMDVAKQADETMRRFSNRTAPGTRLRLATIKRDIPGDLMTDTKGDDDDVIAHAIDEKRLDGGSLVAAAGWCAPSQTVYTLCELETTDGLLDIPEVGITRGGLRFTPGPTFADIFSGAGYFHQTEAQVIAGTTKPCMAIPCPDFQDIRLEVEGVCITGSILQRRGYPEVVDRWIRGAMTAHVHRLNAFVIAAIVAGSGAPIAIGGDVPLDTTLVSGLMADVEMAIVDLKYRNRMSRDATMEVVLPFWIIAVIRADFSRRTGIDGSRLSDADIMAMFQIRNARVQFVYDWQDAFSGLATGPGGAVPLALWPNSVDFLVYPAGTWLRGSDDTIRLDTVYDSANLAQNQYTALFTEEGVLVAQVCNGGSRVYRATICPSGAAHIGLAFVCA